MDATARELNQHTAQVLARVEAGEMVTRNGRPVAVISGYGQEGSGTYPFRTDPMGVDENIPTFSGSSDFSDHAEELLGGFGADD
jgi:antitoxin (DNA-binding transcriptional repressor) of toxin-antitoxin stability system